MPSDAVVEGVSGAIGGIVATIATYPLMTVNTLQATRARAEQAAGPEPQQPADAEAGQLQQRPPPRPARPPPRARGALAEMAALVREGGWPALFSGLEASLIGTTVSQGIYFYLYSLLRRLAVLRRAAAEAGADLRAANITVAESLVVAALAGAGNVLLTNPIWMVATRMQAQSRAKKRAAGGASAEEERGLELGKAGIVQVARQVYAEYGLPGFWNGTAASLVMVINPTLQYALYEWLTAARSRLRRGGGGGGKRGSPPPRASALEVFMLSALAKMGATLVTYPMMMVKTRMYTASRSDDGTHHVSIPASMAQIWREEGFPGYYRGLRTKIVQSVLAAALLFVAKEKITDLTRDVLVGRRRAQTAIA